MAAFPGLFLRQKPEWQIICEASDGLDAIEKSRELHADLILLDIGVPILNVIEAAKQIRKVAPRARVLFLSENTCPEVMREALRARGVRLRGEKRCRCRSCRGLGGSDCEQAVCRMPVPNMWTGDKPGWRPNFSRQDYGKSQLISNNLHITH
jgi:CheY-like chemotaxis protein